MTTANPYDWPAGIAAALAEAPVSRLRALVVPVPPDTGIWHGHDELEVVYHEASHGQVALADGRRQDYAAGSIVVLPGGIRHCSISATAGLHHCVLLRDVPPVANCLAYLPPSVAGRCVPPLRDLIHAATPAADGSLQALASRLRATALLADLLATAAAGQEPADPASGYVERARRYIETHCHELHHLRDVAAAVGISYDHLRRLYRDHSGETLKTTLDRCRLDRARHLLATTNLPLKAVASACGYASDRHLCSRFHAATGHRPTSWRRHAAHS